MDNQKSFKKELTGEVVSNSMTNTVVVKVETKQAHPKYGKIIKSWKKYRAHTEEDIEVGTVVTIQEHRPISKSKKWIVVKK